MYVQTGGRLPVTWYPESFTKVPMNDMRMRANHSTGYPGRTYRFYTGPRVYGFGQGLSYTNYTYKLLSAPNKLNLLRFITGTSTRNMLQQGGEQLNYLNVDEIKSCDSLRFSVGISVMNAGEMDGSHVVMLFSKVAKNLEGTPEKQLIGFDRIHTKSYRSTETSIMVDPCKHLSIANVYGKRVIPLGNHVIMVGDLEHFISVEID